MSKIAGVQVSGKDITILHHTVYVKDPESITIDFEDHTNVCTNLNDLLDTITELSHTIHLLLAGKPVRNVDEVLEHAAILTGKRE